MPESPNSERAAQETPETQTGVRFKFKRTMLRGLRDFRIRSRMLPAARLLAVAMRHKRVRLRRSEKNDDLRL